MSLPVTFDGISELARRMKLDKVIDHGADADEQEADLQTFVVVARGGHEVAMVYSPGTELGAREACYWAACTMRPEELFLVADSRMRIAEEGEDLTEPKAGDFQREWEAGHRERLTEVLVVHRYPAMGPPSGVMLPYERTGKRLRWLEPIDLNRPGQTFEGALIDYVRQGFNDGRDGLAKMKSTLNEAAELMGLDDVDRELHLDRVMARLCSERTGGAVLLFDTKDDDGRPVTAVKFVAGVTV